MTKEDDDSYWRLYPPGTAVPSGVRFLLPKGRKEQSPQEISALLEPLIGSTLTRVEFDEYQLGFIFSSPPRVTAFAGISFLDPSDENGTALHMIDREPRTYGFMCLLGKEVTEAGQDSSRKLNLEFEGNLFLSILKDDEALESYKLTWDQERDFIVV